MKMGRPPVSVSSISRKKVADLLNLIGVMTGELTQEQRSLVSFALASIYEEFGFTEDYTSLYDNDVVMNDRGEFVHHGHKRPMPTFSDFHRKLEEIAQTPGNETLVSVANALRMFKRDGVYGLFDQPTSEDMTNYTDAPVICFDIKQLEENVLRPIGMYNALSWAWEKFAKKNPKLRKRIVCDEAWMLTNPNMPGFSLRHNSLRPAPAGPVSGTAACWWLPRTSRNRELSPGRGCSLQRSG